MHKYVGICEYSKTGKIWKNFVFENEKNGEKLRNNAKKAVLT